MYYYAQHAFYLNPLRIGHLLCVKKDFEYNYPPPAPVQAIAFIVHLVYAHAIAWKFY